MEDTKSVYKYAAEAGVPMGLYLTAMSACLLLSLRLPQLPVLMFPLLLGLPFFTAWLLRRIASDAPHYNKVSALWLAGIYTFIFGSLICCLFSSLYLTFMEPGFVARYMQMAVDTINSSPSADRYAASADVMQKAIDGHLLPTGQQFVLTLAWGTCFMGSFLSLVLAWLLTRRRKNAVTGARG